MDNFDFKAYIANNPLLKEEEEADINSSQLGSDISTLANSLDDAVEDQLEKSEEEEGDINEALDPASLLSYILASNTVVNILSKQAMKIAKKYEWGKGEEAARNI